MLNEAFEIPETSHASLASPVLLVSCAPATPSFPFGPLFPLLAGPLTVRDLTFIVCVVDCSKSSVSARITGLDWSWFDQGGDCSPRAEISLSCECCPPPRLHHQQYKKKLRKVRLASKERTLIVLSKVDQVDKKEKCVVVSTRDGDGSS